MRIKKSKILTDFSGFTSADGSFLIVLKKKSPKGYFVTFKFQLTQHGKDEFLLQSLVSYLGCGRYEAGNGRDWGIFVCTKFSDITDKIIPFFNKSPIVGVKLLDYTDWCKAVEVTKSGGHLKEEGLNQIVELKNGMNKSRS